MGSYTTGEAVFELLVDLKVGPPARFTAADAETLIAGIEAEIDSMLIGQGYTVPATGARDMTMLGQVTRRKVAALVYEHLFQPERSPDWVRTAHIDYADFIKAIRDGQRKLIDQTTEVQQGRRATVGRLRVLPRIVEEGD